MSQDAMSKPIVGAMRVRKMKQSLKGLNCPECKRGQFDLKGDGTNVCQQCGYERVTEWEWHRRQRASEGQSCQTTP